MIAVTFALPQESKHFLAALRHVGKDGEGVQLGNAGLAEIAVAHTGVGLTAAARNVRALLQTHTPRALICAGFAGGLDRALAVGDLVVGTNVSAPELVAGCRRRCTLERRCCFGAIVTEEMPLESAAAKSRLAIRTQALAVEMETRAVAAECARAGVPMLALRVISDSATDALPVPFGRWFDLEKQRPKPLALLRYLLDRPAQIVPFARFVGALPGARQTLARFLLELVDPEGQQAQTG